MLDLIIIQMFLIKKIRPNLNSRNIFFKEDVGYIKSTFNSNTPVGSKACHQIHQTPNFTVIIVLCLSDCTISEPPILQNARFYLWSIKQPESHAINISCVFVDLFFVFGLSHIICIGYHRELGDGDDLHNPFGPFVLTYIEEQLRNHLTDGVGLRDINELRAYG